MWRPCASRWFVLRVGVMNDLQYRVNFALQAPVAAGADDRARRVRPRLFAHGRAQRLSQDELLAVLGVQDGDGRVIRAVIQPNMMRLTEEVRDGKLDHALTKLVDAQMLISVRSSGNLQAVDVVFEGPDRRLGDSPRR